MFRMPDTGGLILALCCYHLLLCSDGSKFLGEELTVNYQDNVPWKLCESPVCCPKKKEKKKVRSCLGLNKKNGSSIIHKIHFWLKLDLK